MTRLGGCIYLSCNVVHINFSFNRILFDRRYPAYKPQCLCRISLTQEELSRIGGPYREAPIWRIAQSIRHELFLQQYVSPNAINLHINVLLPPHCYMENRRSNLDYPRRQHIMLQPRATSASKGNRLPLCLDVCTDVIILHTSPDISTLP
jgi:hypothetical protein